MDGGPLRDVTHQTNINVTNITAENGGQAFLCLLQGNQIGGSVSNSTDVKKSDLRFLTKEISGPDTAGPARKRARLEVCGYVHEVSQLKPVDGGATKEEKHFTVHMQTSTGMMRVHVFNQRSHQAFCDAQTKKLPVRLNCMRFGISDHELIFGETSQLSYMESLDFKYDCQNNEPKTVASVLEATQCPAKQLITITGKITDETQEAPKAVQGQQIMMTKFQLADNTATITLTVWGNKWDISPGRCYTFSSVKVKKFQQQNELTFTPHTKLLEVPCQENMANVSSSKHIRQWKVVCAHVENHHRCICGAELPLTEKNCNSVKCSTCKRRVSAEMIRHTTEGSIDVRTLKGPTSFCIPKSCIKTLLGLDREGFCDTEEAEKKLLQMTVEVVFLNDKVVEIKRVTENAFQD